MAVQSSDKFDNFHFLYSAKNTKHIPFNAIGGASFSQHSCITSENLNGHPAIILAGQRGGAICRPIPYYYDADDDKTPTDLETVLDILLKARKNKPDIFAHYQVWVCLPEAGKNLLMAEYNSRILQLVDKLHSHWCKEGSTPTDYRVLCYTPDKNKYNDGKTSARDAIILSAMDGKLLRIDFSFRHSRLHTREEANYLAAAKPSVDLLSRKVQAPKQLWSRGGKQSDRDRQEVRKVLDPSNSTTFINTFQDKIHVSKKEEARLQQFSENAGLPKLFPAMHHGKSHREKPDFPTPPPPPPPPPAAQDSWKILKPPRIENDSWAHYGSREMDQAIKKAGRTFNKMSGAVLEQSAITPEPSHAHRSRGRQYHGQYSVENSDGTPSPPRRTRSSSPSGIRDSPDSRSTGHHRSRDRDRQREQWRDRESHHSSPRRRLDSESEGSSPAQMHEAGHQAPSSHPQIQQRSKEQLSDTQKNWLSTILRND